MWIAYKLLVENDEHGEVKAGNTIWASVRTIIIADAAMGIDNVIAVAGAAQTTTYEKNEEDIPRFAPSA